MNKNSLDILKEQGTGFKIPKGYFDTVEEDIMLKVMLEKIPKNSGFNTPQEYFETIENQVIEKVTADGFTTPAQFDIPKNYFDTIEDKVFEKIEKEDTAQPKVIQLKPRLFKVLAPIAVAASLLIVLILNYTESDENYSFDNLATADVENWIENDLITLESYAIAEVFDDVNLDEDLNDDDLELLDYINGTDIESALLTD